MLCVPALGVLSLCLAIKLRQTLHRHNIDTVDYAEINSREKTIFSVIFLACICLRKIGCICEPRASEAGGMQGIWHPNYLCGGDIDMYIPLEKPNT